jgi:type II secretory pathway pseudopilin PulG
MQLTPYIRCHRNGFTAVELVVVIGIMLLLTGMAMPGVLSSLRRGAVHSTANEVIDCWRQTRRLAMDEAALDPPRDPHPKHYGLLLVQRAGQRAFAAVVYDNRSADEVASDAMIAPSGAHARPDDDSSAVVLKQPLKRTVAIALSRDDAAPLILDGAILVYAQYGTGWPIDPADVLVGRGTAAAPVGLGIAGRPELGIPASPLATRMRVQTPDYAEAPRHRGYAVDLALYPVGVMAALDG